MMWFIVTCSCKLFFSISVEMVMTERNDRHLQRRQSPAATVFVDKTESAGVNSSQSRLSSFERALCLCDKRHTTTPRLTTE
jgi:hypothetical protein